MRTRAAAACVIQATWKARKARRVFKAKGRIATVLQAWLRGSKARAQFSARLRLLVSTSQSRVMERTVRRVRHRVAIYGQLLLFCDQSMREKAWRSRKRGA
jgi:hypothetical protein